MKKTHLELMQFINLSKVYKQNHPELSGFTHLLSKLDKNIQKAIKEKGHEEVYNEAVEDARYDLCKKYESGEKKGCLLLNEQGGFMFTAENHKKLVKKINELNAVLNATEIELEWGVDLEIKEEPSSETGEPITYNLATNGSDLKSITAEQAIIFSPFMKETELQNNQP